MSISKDYEILLTRGVEEIIVKDDLEKKLHSKKKLRIKYGVDPTANKLHIGHGVCLHKLKEFQELGHQIIFLIGDFTARIGDPTDKSSVRKTLSKEEIAKNMIDYKRQAGKILDFRKIEMRYNSQWLEKMSFADLFRLQHFFTLDRMLERDMFVERRKKHKPIWMHELSYPILQGYDSVELKVDLEIGGTDQKFNMLAARQIQPIYNQTPQDIMTIPLLVGTDGEAKMSQSLGNFIAIDDKPYDMFSKIMSLSDKLIPHYFELAARTAGKELEKIKQLAKDPKSCRDLKVSLARDIVSLYHGVSEVSLAEEEFNRVFRDKKPPLNIPEKKIKKQKCDKVYNLLVELKLVSSKSDARRLIEQGGVKVDEAEISDREAEICLYNGMVVQVGKRKFLKIIV